MVYISLLSGTEIIMSNLRNSVGHVFPNLYFFARRKHLDRRFASIKNVKEYTIDKYYKLFNEKLDLDNPTTFYEKINYLKLNYCDEKSAVLVDKFLVKDYLVQKGYSKYITSPISHYLSFSDFKRDFESIRKKHNQFVLKLSHTSGDVFFYNDGKWREKNGKAVSQRFVFACIKQNIKFNYYHQKKKKNYDLLKGSILIEEYIPSLNQQGMNELKIFVNYGRPVLINYVVGRQNGGHVKEAFLTPDLIKIDAKQDQDILDIDKVDKPPYYDKMLEICKNACGDYPLVRVDYLCDDSSFYFCEFTFYDCSGMNIFYPLERNKELGDLIELKKV